MFRLTLKNVFAHKRRLISTFIAVVLGVSFLTGLLVLTSTINKTFDDLFQQVGHNTDAVVRSATKVQSDFGQDVRGRIPSDLASTVQGVAGVKAVAPEVRGYGQIVGKNGKTLGDPGQGAPTFASAWITVPELRSFTLVEGREPQTDNEVVIDKKSSSDGKLNVGDSTNVITAAGPIPVTVVGVAKFGNADSPGGASFALFNLDAAEKYVAQPGQVDSISVLGDGSVSQAELAQRIQATLPVGVEAITGAQSIKENQDQFEQNIGQFFNFFLLPFAVVAILVAAFSIFNTFSIIVAQRTREMALLRAVGASRRQVLTSIIGEALTIGVVASITGIAVGLGFAAVLKALFKSIGFDVPATGLVLESSTVVIALIVGIGVTLVTSLVPALKASRVPPIAAMRDVALERTHASRGRVIGGIVVTAIALLSLLTGVAAGGDGIGRVGLGALLLIVSLVVLGPVVASPVARFLGWPVTKVRGISGSLARENAMRNPRRTSGSAAALMIGVGVATLFTVFAASVKHSIDVQLDKSFAGDLVIDSGTRGFGGFNPSLAGDVAALPEVSAATGLRTGAAQVNGTDRDVVVIDPKTIESVFNLGVTTGSLESMTPTQLAVSNQYAKDHKWTLGQPVEVRFVDGATETFTVGATFENRDVTGSDWVFSTESWTPHAVDNLDSLILIKLSDGVSIDQGKAAVEQATAAYPNAKVQDRHDYSQQVASMVNQLLALVYVMLLLAIIIALMGIANTLSLSIYERTRELGLLRAVGETRSQLRSMVRWESVIIAVFGTVGGVALGTICAWALVTAASDSGFATFALPTGSLIALVIAGAIAGVLAGLRPAWRAAKLDVLRAIATE
jgi:putative ABC transport system permease protein